MPVGKALHAFTEQRLNCTQSVLKAYKDKHAISDEEIKMARSLGGGRAEDGMCGALYAALQLCDSEETKELLRREFVEIAGSARCREIKRGSGYPCDKCVGLAAGLVEKHNK